MPKMAALINAAGRKENLRRRIANSNPRNASASNSGAKTTYSTKLMAVREGVLWAWIYEKTGSILPGILAHAINNLLVCLAVMALLR